MDKNPKILIITEAIPLKDGGGAKQTLYNLFKNYPKEKLFLLAPASLLKNPPAIPDAKHIISFTDRFIPMLTFGGSLKRILNPIIKELNFFFIKRSGSKLKKIKKINPDIIIVCPIGYSVTITALNIVKNIKRPVITYLMDDWMYEAGKKKDEKVKQLLEISDGWLMISEWLEEILIKRYNISPKKSLVVHNPVDKDRIACENSSQIRTGKFSIAYAGSIWPMHYDAVLLTAKAVHLLRKENIDIEFVLYTGEYFWEKYQEQWTQYEVVNGGWVKYDELNYTLKEADLLLLAAAFSKDQENMSRASVQTKITDYFASGRIILSVGPEYGAGNRFIRKHECGLVYDKNKSDGLKDFLKIQIEKRKENQLYANKGIDVLFNNFESNLVSEKLYSFIKGLKN
jgi:glycosyltransferase involved in cell wall biosynthesis